MRKNKIRKLDDELYNIRHAENKFNTHLLNIYTKLDEIKLFEENHADGTRINQLEKTILENDKFKCEVTNVIKIAQSELKRSRSKITASVHNLLNKLLPESEADVIEVLERSVSSVSNKRPRRVTAPTHFVYTDSDVDDDTSNDQDYAE
jgi:hypothetical protein